MAIDFRALWLLVVVSTPVMAQPFQERMDCGLEPPGTVFWPPLPKKPDEVPPRPEDPPLVSRMAPMPFKRRIAGTANPRLRKGVLSGKTVYVSPGHGFFWTDAQNAWRTQRGNNNNIVEDFVSVETAAQYLVPLLMNAGATVRPVREIDMNPLMAIVDDGDSSYAEEGSTADFADGPPGWGTPPPVINDGTALFSLGKTRELKASATTTASVTWTPDVPADGHYNVYVSFASGANRVRDAHYVVTHPGGESHFFVNQQRHGSTWTLLGRFYFKAGKNEQRARVKLLNHSASPNGKVLSIDAIRLGGGKAFAYERSRPSQPAAGRGSSNRPNFEQAARYGVQFYGASRDVYDSPTLLDGDDDVGSRARFAAWDHVEGEDAVYVAWHTNATGTGAAASGTETFVYGPGAPYQCTQPTPVEGSLDLGKSVHEELVGDLRKGWDPLWKDRQLRCAYFGEVNPNYNPETPAILVEVAFHERPPDADALKEAKFRYIAARAIAQGIIKYFGRKDGVSVVLPPEPPVQLFAHHVKDGNVEVRWAPAPLDQTGLSGDEATSYRVYTSVDGLAWDDGVDVAKPMFHTQLALGATRYFRIAALNAGGESLPSEVVGVRVGTAPAPVLIVNAYTRLDATLNVQDNLSAYALATVQRMFIEKMNDGTYVRHHGDALSVPFDSASGDAVVADVAPLRPYEVVSWFVGRGAAGGKPPAPGEQQRLRAFLSQGGGVLFSGTELAASLSAGTAEDVAFRDEVLKVGPPGVADAGGLVQGSTEHFLRDVADVALDDGSGTTYRASGLSEVRPSDGGVVIAHYVGGTVPAATAAASGAGKVVFLGFPFETVTQAQHRSQLMERFLSYLTPAPPLAPDAGEPDSGIEVDAGVDTPDASSPVERPALTAESAVGASVGAGCGCGAAQGSMLTLMFALGLPMLLRRASRRTCAGPQTP